MKIIVCGAGNVGRCIISYLILGNNDIVVIDNNAAKLEAIAKEFDIRPVFGAASHPEVLEKAGAVGADMLIAATGCDEVNMVACEVGAAIFNIPKRIARVDNQDFLSPLWGGLFNDRNIPIDLIISPEMEVAEKIASLLKNPGMFESSFLAKRRFQMLAFRCQPHSETENMSIMQVESILPSVRMRIFCIIRNGNSFIPSAECQIQSGDIVYFLTPAIEADSVIRGLGMEKSAIEKTVTFSGGNIARYLANILEKDDNILSRSIIEEDRETARLLAQELQNTAIINGDMMSDVIMEEAGLASCDAAIAVTPHDKDNLLISLLSKQHNLPLSVCLVNTTNYNNFIENLSSSVIVDRSAVIISSMLQELRKARIVDAYSLGLGFGEVWEVIISEYNPNLGRKICELDLPPSCMICALCRDEETLFPTPEATINAGDTLILYVGAKSIKRAEKLFA